MGFQLQRLRQKEVSLHGLAPAPGCTACHVVLGFFRTQGDSQPPGLVSVLGSRVQVGFRAGTLGHPVLLPESPGSAVSVAPFPLLLMVAEFCIIGAGFPVRGVVGLGPRACRSRRILLLPFPEWPRGKQACHSFHCSLGLRLLLLDGSGAWGVVRFHGDPSPAAFLGPREGLPPALPLSSQEQPTRLPWECRLALCVGLPVTRADAVSSLQGFLTVVSDLSYALL